jgi:hypothetical protein
VVGGADVRTIRAESAPSVLPRFVWQSTSPEFHSGEDFRIVNSAIPRYTAS